MRIDRIRPDRPPSSDLLIIRLVRRWAATRMLGEDALIAMTRLVADTGEPPVVAVALHSVLQITEECLGDRCKRAAMVPLSSATTNRRSSL